MHVPGNVRERRLHVPRRVHERLRGRGRRAWRAGAAFVLACVLARDVQAAEPQAPPTPAPLVVADRERLLVVAPHPDDEVLGAGGLVQRVLARGGAVEVVLVTAGDGYPDAVRGELGIAAPQAADFVAYGARRIAEARAALAALAPTGDGAAANGRVRVTALGFPDGALAMLRAEHWPASAPVRSSTTGAADPPYDGLVADDAAPYAGEVLLAEMTRVVARLRPTLVALPDPLDTHPDHATAGLFALAALADARSDARIAAYLVHWPSWPPGWDAASADPAAAAYGLDRPADLPPRGRVAALSLTPDEIDGKRRALALHATQQRQMAVYLDAFVRVREPYTLLTSGAAARARATLRAAPADP